MEGTLTSEIANTLRRNGFCGIGISTTSVLEAGSRSGKGIYFWVGIWYLKPGSNGGCSLTEDETGDFIRMRENTMTELGLKPGGVSPLDSLRLRETYPETFVVFSEMARRLHGDTLVVLPDGDRDFVVASLSDLRDRLDGFVLD